MIEQGKPFPHNDKIYHRLKVRNDGIGANSCVGKLTLSATEDNVEETIAVDTIMTKRNFTQLEEMNVCWSRGDVSTIDIHAKSSESLDILRVVKEHKASSGFAGIALLTVPLHFEIPSEYGWKPIRVALKPKDYDGLIKIASMNSEPATGKFKIKYDPEKSDVTIELE